MMVTLNRIKEKQYTCKASVYDIHDIAKIEKKVPIEWIDTKKKQMKQEFIKYAKPLIQGELQPIYKDGLPVHLIRQ